MAEVLAANKVGIECPACGHTDSSVKDSRPAKNAISRRRVCAKCTVRFSTTEQVSSDMHVHMQGVAAVSLSDTANRMVAQAVRAKRALLQMTQQELAVRLGLSPYLVVRLERNGVVPAKLRDVVRSWLVDVK